MRGELTLQRTYVRAVQTAGVPSSHLVQSFGSRCQSLDHTHQTSTLVLPFTAWTTLPPHLNKHSLALPQVLTRCVIALIFLLTAAAITGLSNYNNATSYYTLSWSRDKLYVDATAAVTGWLPRPPPLLRNAPLPPAGAVNVTLACRAALPDTCTPHFRGPFGLSLKMTFGSLLQWGNLTEGLLYQRPALKALQAAAVSAASLTSANATPYAAC